MTQSPPLAQCRRIQRVEGIPMRATFHVLTFAMLVLATMAGNASAENTPPPPPNKRNCQNTVPFSRWIEDFKREAVADGIQPRTIEAAIGGMTPDISVIARDRKQGFFSQTFINFISRSQRKAVSRPVASI